MDPRWRVEVTLRGVGFDLLKSEEETGGLGVSQIKSIPQARSITDRLLARKVCRAFEAVRSSLVPQTRTKSRKVERRGRARSRMPSLAAEGREEASRVCFYHARRVVVLDGEVVRRFGRGVDYLKEFRDSA